MSRRKQINPRFIKGKELFKIYCGLKGLFLGLLSLRRWCPGTWFTVKRCESVWREQFVITRLWNSASGALGTRRRQLMGSPLGRSYRHRRVEMPAQTPIPSLYPYLCAPQHQYMKLNQLTECHSRPVLSLWIPFTSTHPHFTVRTVAFPSLVNPLELAHDAPSHHVWTTRRTRIPGCHQ